MFVTQLLYQHLKIRLTNHLGVINKGGENRELKKNK